MSTPPRQPTTPQPTPSVARAVAPLPTPAPNAAHSDQFIGVMLIVLTLLGWTSIPLFLKHFAAMKIDPWTANGWRYGFSALLWVPVLIIGSARRTLPPGLWRAALVPSLFNTAAQVCFAIAPYMIDPGLMTFSMRLQIVFLTTGAALLFPAERRIIKSPGFLAGISMVLIGTCITLLLKPDGLGGGTAKGIALAITAGFLYAAYGLSVRHFMHGMKPFPAFAAVSQYTALVIVTLMFIWGDKQSSRDLVGGMHALDLSALQFGLLLLSSVIGIGIGHTMYFASIARLGLAVSSGVVQLQPITVSICSYFLFDELLTPGQWGGGLVAIAGAGIMLFAQHRLQKRRLAPAALEPAAEAEDPAAILCAACGFDLEGLPNTDPCPQCGKTAAETGDMLKSS